MKASHAVLVAAGLVLVANGALAQQTSTGPNRDTGSGTVSTETGKQSPIANPKVKGDKSTIKGDKRATTEQRTGSE